MSESSAAVRFFCGTVRFFCGTVPGRALLKGVIHAHAGRRCWTLLETERFGPVMQTEIGAFVVGGIVNERENETFCKGEEMGHFELAGSAIVLLFQKDRIRLASHIRRQLAAGREFRVPPGMCLGGALCGT